MKVSMSYPLAFSAKKYDISSLMQDKDLKEKLDKAADEAKLNVTERLALNREFYPYGGGFELFPEDVRVPQINTYYSPNEDKFDDSFTREVAQLEIPEHICQIKEHIGPSSKGNFRTNLDNGLKKLKKALIGMINQDKKD